MFTAILYTFSKSTNSTKTPSGGGTTFSCRMVSPSGVLNPTFTFNLGVNQNPSGWNYCRIEEFGRYYWITEWTWENGVWNAYMTVDSLASWRTDILDCTEYVLRSASTSSPEVVDTYYPAVNSFSYSNVYFQPWDKKTLASGSYVIGLLGAGEGTTGGVTYYIASQTLLNQFMTSIMSEPSWMGIPAEISEELMKCLVNPLQYVTSVMWFPIDPNAWASSATVPYVGWWKPDVALLAYTSDYVVDGMTIGTRASHPQSGGRTYLNYSPYTRLSLSFPPFGTVELNPDQFPPGSEIIYEMVVDGISGVGNIKIYSSVNPQAPIKLSGNVGVPLSVGQSSNSFEASAGSALGALGSSVASTGHPLDKMVGGVFTGVGDAISFLHPQFSGITYGGGTSSFTFGGNLIQEFVRTTETDNEHLGTPLCKKRKLSSLSGYTMILDADVDIPATSVEKSQIISFMEEGFYIE